MPYTSAGLGVESNAGSGVQAEVVECGPCKQSAIPLVIGLGTGIVAGFFLGAFVAVGIASEKQWED